MTALTRLLAVLLIATAACSAPNDDRPAVDAPAGDAAAGRIELGAPMLGDRAVHTATLLADGTVLLAGGFGDDEVGLDTAELYDPRTRRFEPAAGMTTVRKGGHASHRLPDGRVLIIGGWSGNAPTASAEIYDPATRTFAPTGRMATPRAVPAVAPLPDGRVLVAGGYDGSRSLGTAEIYDPAADAFVPTGPLTAARTGAVAAPLADGRVLVAGGAAKGVRGVVATAELFDPKTGTFTATGAMTVPRHKHAAAPLPDGRILIVGGSDDRDWTGQHDSAEAYDPANGDFNPVGPMHAHRFKIGDAVAQLPDGRLVVAGSDPTVETFDVDRAGFAVAAGRIDAEYQNMTATPLADGTVLVAGGYDPDIDATAQTWLVHPG